MPSNSQPHSAGSYRPDIDGLRAIAVLSVIAYHANSDLVPGGFVGVDIFFVISGFLITGLIAIGIEGNSFSFTGFYARRIKRIFPAYIVVALATLAVSSWMLIPNDYIFFTTSLAASWAFLSNVFFSMLSWGYFGQRTAEFPLLHTWSLSVEEQFYFLFPLLLLFLYRYLRPRLVPVLVLLCIVFVAFSEWRTHQVGGYFLLSARAHELIIGALCFFAVRRYPPRSNLVAAACALSGVALIIGSLFGIGGGMRYPGLLSLPPCAGAALLIYAGAREHLLKPVLGSRPAVFVGLISYSLYLWHWPIFSFLHYRGIPFTGEVVAAAIALTFLLSIATWALVETPIRRNRAIQFKRAFIQIYLAPCALFMTVGLYSYVTEGAPARFDGDMRELISSYSFARDLTHACSIRENDYRKVTYDYLLDHCAFGDASRKNAQLLLIGDSHADHFKPFLDRLATRAGIKGVFHVQGGCFPFRLPELEHHPDGQATTCEKRNEDLLKLAGHFRYVALAGFWSSKLDPQFGEKLGIVVQRVIDAGAIPIVFKDNPYYEPDISRCVLNRKRGWIPASADCSIPYSFVARTESKSDHIIDEVRARHPQMLVIDPKRVMCQGAKCLTYIDNTALYKDANHINLKASLLLGDRYIAAVGNPLQGIDAAAPALATGHESVHADISKTAVRIKQE